MLLLTNIIGRQPCATAYFSGVLISSVMMCRGNTLHGGFNPLFENSTWDVLESSDNHVKLHFTSPEGAQVLCPTDTILTLAAAANAPLPMLLSAVDPAI